LRSLENFVMSISQDNALATHAKRPDLRFYITREPLILVLLSALAVVLFLAVTGLSRAYHAQQQSLGNRWFTRGVGDLRAGHYGRAVIEFRTALLYARDNYSYQRNLAEALVGLKRTDEAYAYLINLWERQPENGLVNLELARIAAQRGDREHALRYYHNAIYATWPNDQEGRRRETRLELVEYLLRIQALPQAQAELIALAANLGDDPAQQARVGELFLRAQDYEHALSAYRVSLRADRHNTAALAGAGEAAFELERYSLAQRYLQSAVAANPSDTGSAERLKTAEMVLRMDPYRRHISVAERDRLVVQAFATAGQRLVSCVAQAGSASSPDLRTLSETVKKMKPKVTLRGLRRDPDLVEEAMSLVFSVERQTETLCGPASGKDQALLLISRLHEGS
jgi:tetratricopeptide (TPR) repeat protein